MDHVLTPAEIVEGLAVEVATGLNPDDVNQLRQTVGRLRAQLNNCCLKRDALRLRLGWLEQSPAKQTKRISYVDGHLDDVAISCDMFRLEQMSPDAWWVAACRGDKTTMFWLHWDRKTKNIIATVTCDDIPPAEGGMDAR